MNAPLFARQARGLLDFGLAVIAIWAAGYHTPLGASIRALTSELLGVKTTARPLLAYYSGGVDPSFGLDRQDAPALPKPVAPTAFLRVAGTVPAAEAMGYGAQVALSQASSPRRAVAEALALRFGPEPLALDESRGPQALAKLISAAGRDLGSVEAGVLALFVGYDTAQFAQERARAGGYRITLEALSRQLPPGMDEPLSLAGKALALGTAYSLSWPVPEETRVSSPFGVRIHPVLGTRKMHTGVDLSVPQGTAVHATAPGTIRRASLDNVNGRVLVIEHDHGITTAYCHNSELLVTVGQRVKVGDLVALSGNTGRSTGPHLHYQLELSGTPMDPVSFRASRPGMASGTGL